MMTRKHYKAIAQAIKFVVETYDTDSATVSNIKKELCKAFQRDNPKFDWGKFNDACRPEEVSDAELMRRYRAA